MSGHSKWATTKHKKAAIDAKRSALFSKHSRNITVAARVGGDPSPENNAALSAAVARARMTGLEVAGVNLRIEDVLTSEEYDKSKTSADETLDADPSKGESVEEDVTE